MPNIAELMRGKVEELVKAPPALPIGEYPAIIRKFEYTTFEGKGENAGKSYNKLRVSAQLSGWPESGVDDDQKGDIIITQRSISCDYWLPVERRLAVLFQQCGITGDVHEGTPAELIGHRVLALVKHRVDKNGEPVAFADAFIGVD